MNGSNVLEYQLEDNTEDIQLGAQMIYRHKPEGLLPIEVKQASRKLIVYKKEHVTLSSHLERTVLSDLDLARLFKSIVGPLDGLDRYYLSGNHVSLDYESIYYNQDQGTAAFVYGLGSAGSREKLEVRLKALLRDIIYEYARLEAPNSDFISDLLKYLKEPGWHLKGLLYVISEHINAPKASVSHGGHQDYDLSYNQDYNQSYDKGYGQDYNYNHNQKNDDVYSSSSDESVKSPISSQRKRPVSILNSRASRAENIEAKPKIKHKKAQDMAKSQSGLDAFSQNNPAQAGKGFQMKHLIGAVLILIFSAIMLWAKYADFTSSEHLGLLVVSGAMLTLIGLKLIALVEGPKAKEENDKDEKSRHAKMNRKSKQNIRGNNKGKQKNKAIKSKSKENHGFKEPAKASIIKRKKEEVCDQSDHSAIVPPPSRFVVKEVDDVQGPAGDRTVMLSPKQSGFALHGAGGHRIPLEKDIIIIGRQEGVADILIHDNSSIGRQHAKLVRLDSGYAVKDLKSINGTFVNNQKVLPDQAIALMDGDTLRISDEKFVYKTTA